MDRRRRTRVQDLRHYRAGERLSGDGKLLLELYRQVWEIRYLGVLLILESTLAYPKRYEAMSFNEDECRQ
jgi:hypothetical protein